MNSLFCQQLAVCVVLGVASACQTESPAPAESAEATVLVSGLSGKKSDDGAKSRPHAGKGDDNKGDKEDNDHPGKTCKSHDAGDDKSKHHDECWEPVRDWHHGGEESCVPVKYRHQHGGQGKSCAAFDDCAVDNGGCPATATCTTTANGGHTCTDINECLVNNGGCDPHAACTNTVGGNTCQCKVGYTGSGDHCADMNECVQGNGGCSGYGFCTNTDGSFYCTCKPGYTGDGKVCTPIAG